MAKNVPFLPPCETEVPEEYAFSKAVQDGLADAEMMSAHADHIAEKGNRVERIVNDRRHKRIDTVKVDVPANVPYMYGTKEKRKLSPKEIKAARRAKRKYGTDYWIYSWGKANYGKLHSRKHRELCERRFQKGLESSELANEPIDE